MTGVMVITTELCRYWFPAKPKDFYGYMELAKSQAAEMLRQSRKKPAFVMAFDYDGTMEDVTL